MRCSVAARLIQWSVTIRLLIWRNTLSGRAGTFSRFTKAERLQGPLLVVDILFASCACKAAVGAIRGKLSKEPKAGWGRRVEGITNDSSAGVVIGDREHDRCSHHGCHGQSGTLSCHPVPCTQHPACRPTKSEVVVLLKLTPITEHRSNNQ